MTSKYILDTYAWVEYFQGSAAGDKVRQIIETAHCYTPAIVLAELSYKYEKEGLADMERDVLFIESNSSVTELGSNIAKNAGKIKHEVRKKYKSNFSLADAIILATALSLEAKVLTGDYHFKKLKNVEYIR